MPDPLLGETIPHARPPNTDTNKQCALKKIVPETAKRRRRTHIDHGTFRRKCGIRELHG